LMEREAQKGTRGGAYSELYFGERVREGKGYHLEKIHTIELLIRKREFGGDLPSPRKGRKGGGRT